MRKPLFFRSPEVLGGVMGVVVLVVPFFPVGVGQWIAAGTAGLVCIGLSYALFQIRIDQELRERQLIRDRQKQLRLDNSRWQGFGRQLDDLKKDRDEYSREQSLPARVALASAHLKLFINDRWLSSAPPLLDRNDPAAVQRHEANTLAMFRMFFAEPIGQLIREVYESGNAPAINHARHIEPWLAGTDINNVKTLVGALNTLVLSLDKP